MICEFCKAPLPKNTACQELYDKLAFYTLSKTEPFFIHQLAVDAYAAQHPYQTSEKTIKLAFALIGLYLFSEKNYTGRQVQLAHMQLANTKRAWPTFTAPKDKGGITIADVIKVPEGPHQPGKPTRLSAQRSFIY